MSSMQIRHFNTKSNHKNLISSLKLKPNPNITKCSLLIYLSIHLHPQTNIHKIIRNHQISTLWQEHKVAVEDWPSVEGCSQVTVADTSAGTLLHPHPGLGTAEWAAREAAMPAGSEKSWCPCRLTTHSQAGQQGWKDFRIERLLPLLCPVTNQWDKNADPVFFKCLYLSTALAVQVLEYFPASLFLPLLRWNSPIDLFKLPQLWLPNTYKQRIFL